MNLHDIVLIRWLDPDYVHIKDRKIPVPRGHNTVGYVAQITEDHVVLAAERLIYSDGITDDRSQTRVSRQHIHDVTVLKKANPLHSSREDVLYDVLLQAARS